MPSMPPVPCSVLLLSGGRGQRMGGRDKGLIDWRGRPLIAWLHALVRPLTDDLIISCNRNAERYGRYADQLVSDDSPDFPGPLAGIRAGLKAARHDHLLVLPCDAPLLDRELLDALLAQVGEHPVMLHRGGYWEPLFAVLPTRLKEAVEQAWLAGERSPQRIFRERSPVAVECDIDDPRLANLNSPELLASAAEDGDRPRAD
ncbi:molybdenum cofactor guanylyltransferase MobA [Pseudomonas kuykendallii]|uniref:Molybdenum cofactor guanylyltransferase n=1 Tax=Pseudomonas kuykendallii TaxID=1007099 RepID=A0A1H3BJU6_9PSED|nr:molybdenum cofactor guanylyltransferase MobA [Pseudomonas kuykendallii]MCQ4269892.1 molybdenum cofactor guanylyltransferase MobA [Pseudomonas kuykendallii]SDX42157.1 molybdenum cofactor guanylyltransferase [Pseudomonas kuykendallii]